MSSASFRKSLAGKQVACVCTGGNIESSLLAKVIDKGLVSDGRMVRIRVAVEDRPGHLNQLCQLIGNQFRYATPHHSNLFCLWYVFAHSPSGSVLVRSANIRDVYHERAFLQSEDVGYTQAVFALETRGFEHIDQIITGLRAAGFASAQEMRESGAASVTTASSTPTAAAAVVKA
jgi:threonine dehydratase